MLTRCLKCGENHRTGQCLEAAKMSGIETDNCNETDEVTIEIDNMNEGVPVTQTITAEQQCQNLLLICSSQEQEKPNRLPES
ncbi:hypothetical protein TNCT_326211 [Trichonephila clavata]|uniref:Uncharacterized protein n=1 Tax=Trichonephila clavata TaxID=2740835 RepID=A0A8X6HV54_TRICU|nr:hypothetical protein TNCT_326211 [Trichonephila clavata]